MGPRPSVPRKPIAPGPSDWTGRVEHALLLTVLAVVPFALFQSWHGHLDYPRRVIAGGGVAIVLVLVGFGLLRGAGVRFWWGGLAWAVVAFLALGLQSLQVATSPFDGVLVWCNWCACALVAYFLGLTCSTSGRRRSVFVALTVVGAGTAGLGLAEALTGWNPFAVMASPSSFFVNRNYAAHVATIVLPAACYLLCAGPRRSVRVAGVVVAGMLGAYLFHTGARAAGLAVAASLVSLAALLAVTRGQPGVAVLLNRRSALHAVLAVVIALSAGLGAREAMREAKPPEQDSEQVRANADPSANPFRQKPTARHNDTVKLRLAAYENGLILAARYPWRGVGVYGFGDRIGETAPHNFAELFSEDATWYTAHGDWVQFIPELGMMVIPVLIVAGLLAMRIVVNLIRGRGGERSEPAIWPFAVAALAGFCVHMAGDFPAYCATPPLLAASHAALVVREALDRCALSAGLRFVALRRRPALGAALMVSGVAAAIAASWLGTVLAHAVSIEQQRRAILYSGRWEAVARLARAEQDWLPWRPGWRQDLASALIARATTSFAVQRDTARREAYLEEARLHLDMYLRKRPQAGFARYLRGLVALDQRDAYLAEFCFSEAIRLAPDVPRNYLVRAAARERLGDQEGVIADLTAVWTLSAGPNVEDGLGLASRLIDAGRSHDAVLLLENARERFPGNAQIAWMLGKLLLDDSTRHAEALSLIEPLLEDPNVAPDEMASVRARVAAVQEILRRRRHDSEP